jgi:4-alpha-glucanotransferase
MVDRGRLGSAGSSPAVSVTEERDQVNLPGTTNQHPNWRRKQSLSLEELSTNPRVRALAHVLNSARPPLSSRKSPNVR